MPMPIQDLTRPIDALVDDRVKLQRLFLVLGAALFVAFFLPWGVPMAGPRWEMNLFVDIWPFLWAMGFGAVGASKLLKLPFRPRPFGMGVALLTFGGLGLAIVSLKLAGDFSGFLNAFFLGTHPYLVTGALGHLGLFTILVALYLRAREPGWAPARYAAISGGGLLLLGMLIPGKSSLDAFPLVALFRQTSGVGVLFSLYCLGCMLITLGLAASPFLPKEKLPPLVHRLAPLMLLSLLPLAWLLFWILGGHGAWQDIYSIPHRILTLGGLIVGLCLGAELVVKALNSTDRDRFQPWDLLSSRPASSWDTDPEQPPPHHSPNHSAHHQAPHQPFAHGHPQPYPQDEGHRRQQGHGHSHATASGPHAEAESPCPVCGSDLEWIAEYERWYCRRCSQYL